jgi:AcrR family transcriptional regulator
MGSAALKLNTKVRQKQIIEISMAIITQKGIQGLTIKEISKAIGISEQAIYRHFENKLAILFAIIEYFNENLSDSFNYGSSIKSPLAKIKDLTIAHVQYLQDNPSAAAILFSDEIFRNEKELVDIVNAILKTRLKAVTGLVEESIGMGESKGVVSAENIALLFLGSLRLLVKEWQISGFSFSLVERGRQLVDELIGLLKK